MKRKLALALAAVMTVAAMPATLFAASNNSITGTVNADEKTILYESSMSVSPSSGELEGSSDIEYYDEGTYLKIKMNDSELRSSDEITLTLTNAQWFFRSLNTVGTPPTTSTYTNVFTETGNLNASGTPPMVAGTSYSYSDFDAAVTANEIDSAALSNTAVIAFVALHGSSNIDVEWTVGTPDDTMTFTATVTTPGAGGTSDTEITNKLSAVSTSGTNALPSDLEITYDITKGLAWLDGNNNVFYERNTSQLEANELPFTMVMTGISTKTATVTVPTGLADEDYILVPLVLLTTDAGTYQVTIEGKNVSAGTKTIGSNISGKTVASVSSLATGRTEFKLKDLVIKELKTGTIKNNSQFTLKAPSGYTWDSTSISNLRNSSNSAGDGIYTVSSLTWAANSSTGRMPSGADVTVALENDETLLRISFGANAFNTTTSSKTGSIYLDGLILQADDEDNITSDKQLSVILKDTGKNESFTNQTLAVAKVVDYDVTLTLVGDDVPTIVSGRLDGMSILDGNSSTDNYDDESHETATVKMAEKVADAWWAQRTTKLSLPEEVKILKVEFDEIQKMASGYKDKMMTGTNSSGDGIYYNIGKKAGNISIDDNVLTLSNLSVEANEKASFEMTFWVTSEVTFEGDIDLTLNGSSLVDSDDDVSVTIATAIVPVEIETSVSEVKIGYQYVSVADFDVIETAAGNLLYNEEVYITVTDEISVDMNIATGFTAAVTDGDIKISRISTSKVLSSGGIGKNVTEGTISFEVDRASTEASTISFKNVQVKVDRNVAYSNLSNEGDRGINIVVWGPAVASNYYYLDQPIASTNTVTGYDSDNWNDNDTFTIAGISAKYINVVTTAENNLNNAITNVVVVTMGNPVVQVNGVDFTMPVAAYVSTASNSTMVPVRFIAVALGLAEDKVSWDAVNSTVTIDAGTRIVQFQVGNTNYSINGTSVAMTSPDGLPVACEVTNERAFVPFRALANAFAIEVSWDATTATATYNAATVQ